MICGIAIFTVTEFTFRNSNSVEVHTVGSAMKRLVFPEVHGTGFSVFSITRSRISHL